MPYLIQFKAATTKHSSITSVHYLFMVFYEDLHHNVLELDVHDGSHRLLLGPHQRGTEHDAQVGHRHHVDFAVSYDPDEEKQHRDEARSDRSSDRGGLKETDASKSYWYQL